ncbi:hypothetical protein [Calothrix sp. NIES-2098]|uniref:hypothetical protein n=1 Tax=Calothrix sp. NIES-2098 TaxID=1954171 RepID=UPI000B601DB0|nr:hypothetical protein NIES2098_41960 [Calothrix sp. NIES-2098]
MRAIARQILNTIIDQKLVILHCDCDDDDTPESWVVICEVKKDYPLVLTTAAPYTTLHADLWRGENSLTQWVLPLENLSQCITKARGITKTIDRALA